MGHAHSEACHYNLESKLCYYYLERLFVTSYEKPTSDGKLKHTAPVNLTWGKMRASSNFFYFTFFESEVYPADVDVHTGSEPVVSHQEGGPPNPQQAFLSYAPG